MVEISGRVVGVAAAVAVALAGGAGGEEDPGAKPSATERDFVPSHFDQVYRDGRIVVRYPRAWTRSTSSRFGVVLADDTTRYSAFVSIKYLPDRELPLVNRFAELAAAVIRPGGRLIPLYTQSARVGGLRGIEAGFIWPVAGTRGPLMRAYGFDRGRQGVAFLVFASEKPTVHASDFGWVKRTIVWTREPRRERRPALGGAFEDGY